jgi:4-amino-4-deoxy-L-arabinose transferase-like glycosyltransferase
MNSSGLRKIALIYPLLLILCGIGYAKYDSYQLDGDAVAFMDIADAIHTHDFALAVNGYWNPAYAAALSVGETIAHSSRWNELQTFYWVNFWIFVGCIFACIYFVRSLLLVRERYTSDAPTLPALSPTALLLFSLAFLFYGFQRELSIGTVRADALLLFFFFFAASFLLRIQAKGRFIYYPLLGLALGLAYLTKSFAFLPSGFLLAAIFIFGLTRKSPMRGRILAGALVAGFVFTAVAGPYIVAISKQRGRPTTGESARLNYSFFIDNTGRWHEWHSGDLGHATANFKHHEQLIIDSPPVYSYAQHPIGTYPLWFDPSYWTDTIQPRFYLKGHLLRLARNSVVLVRFIVGHLEPFVVLGVLLLAGCFFARQRASWLPLLPVPLWGLLMFGIYFPIDFQDRYLTAAFLFVVIPVLAMLRRSRNGNAGDIATALAILLAALTLTDAASDLGQRRRMLSIFDYPRGAYSKDIYPTAKGLRDLGIVPGQTVACFGDTACYIDQYWARLAGTPILAEIEVPSGGDPGEFWKAQTNHAEILNALRARNIAAIVATFQPSAHIPDGWQQLGASNFYAYVLMSAPVSH